MATCFISENGLKIVVEDAKCVQVSAFIGADLFQVKWNKLYVRHIFVCLYFLGRKGITAGLKH